MGTIEHDVEIPSRHILRRISASSGPPTTQRVALDEMTIKDGFGRPVGTADPPAQQMSRSKQREFHPDTANFDAKIWRRMKAHDDPTRFHFLSQRYPPSVKRPGCLPWISIFLVREVTKSLGRYLPASSRIDTSIEDHQPSVSSDPPVVN